MKKAEKAVFVDDLAATLQGAKGVVLVNYTGLNVKAQQALKAKLKESGSKMVVVKNTLLKRAATAAKIDKGILEDSILQGQTALVISGDDPIAPIQILGKFAKESVSEAGLPVPKFKVGVVDGVFQDEASLTKISTLPGRDVLLGQLLGVLISPKHGLVGTLQGNMQKLVYILKRKAG